MTQILAVSVQFMILKVVDTMVGPISARGNAKGIVYLSERQCSVSEGDFMYISVKHI